MRALAAILLATALAACVTSEPAQPGTSYLNGTGWRRVDDMNANPHGVTMDFNDTGASGDTGCNRWFASVAHEGEVLRFGNVGTTRRACTSEVQAGAERSFLEMLPNTRYGHYDQHALVLLDENQHQIARFESTQ